MADLFAVVFDPNNVYEIRTSKAEEAGGGAKSLNFRGGEIPKGGRAKSLGISPRGGGGQIPGGGREIPATPVPRIWWEYVLIY